MTTRICLIWVVMTLSVLACASPAWVDVPTAGHDTPVPMVMTTETKPKAVMTAQVIATESLHVRKAPGHDKLRIGYLYHGDTVTLTGQCLDGWAQIEWEDSTAWVNADFLSSNKCSEK